MKLNKSKEGKEGEEKKLIYFDYPKFAEIK